MVQILFLLPQVLVQPQEILLHLVVALELEHLESLVAQEDQVAVAQVNHLRGVLALLDRETLAVHLLAERLLVEVAGAQALLVWGAQLQ
jgi:hypothetical protein